ncbi:DUF4040 domain-containing protein [Thiocapsa bogorovii]|nr:DUF4040 domain-containing protein [Thiocapsa bogorovii]UHD14387.1 DUF4040 domain-containing protein [Thiocapsa bogorovii]
MDLIGTMELIAPVAWAIDGLLALLLLWLAARALSSPRLLEAVVLFVGFGLTLALVWVRLDAPDIALAEAAIGAGLTGALLLAALARLPMSMRAESGQTENTPSKERRDAET